MEIKKASKLGVKDNAVFLIATDKDLSLKNFSKEEIILDLWRKKLPSLSQSNTQAIILN